MSDLITKFAVMLAIVFGSAVLGLLFKGIDRILSARMQKRVGPPLLQPFYDLRKLMVKESVIPKYAVKWVFELAPFISLIASILILFYTPIAGKSVLGNSGDLILIIYLFILPGLGLVLGAFSSNSPYSNIGGQRLAINMLGYEFPLAIVSLIPVWIVSKNGFSDIFSLSAIYNHNIWSLIGPIGIVGLLIETAVVFIVISGELSSPPFDADTADSEIAGGVLAEYSGRNLAMFYLAGIIKTIAIASLFIALFFPWSVQANFAVKFLIYLLKLGLMIFIGSTLMRTSVSRFKISRLTRNYWGYVGCLAIIGFLLVWVDTFSIL